ncbi:hypothetical protein P9112_001817 [Eukaryota sp. TZLM1-RC]
MSHLECGICLQIMEQPTTLPCGHSFCRDRCLLPSKKHSSTCPQCREVIPSMCHRINITLRDIIESSTQHSPEPQLCKGCEEAPANLFCSDCDACFCQKCSVLVHSVKLFQSHNIVPLSERSNVSLPKCPHHKAKQIEHYCTKCKVALCDSCGLLQGHSLHHEALVSFSQAKEAFTKQVQEFQANTSTITPLLVQSGDKVESVVRETLNQSQSILHDLIGDLIRQSGLKIQQLESSNTVEESLAFDGAAKGRAQEEIQKIYNVVDEFKTTLFSCFDNLESETIGFKLYLLGKLLGKELIDVDKLNISKRAQELVFAAQIGHDCVPSRDEIDELIPLEIDFELKQKLIINFINNSKSINVSDFIWLFNLESNLVSNIDFDLVISKLEFGRFSNQEFINIVNYAIQHSTSLLLSKVIDNYSFEIVPELPTIPGNLLSSITLTNSLNKMKEEWLEKVIKKNCSRDNIGEISRSLLGRELMTKTISVGVWVDSGWITELPTKLNKGLTENWGDLEVVINSSSNAINNYNELEPFDVVVLCPYQVSCPGQYLNQLLEAGKGLVLFNFYPSSSPQGFNYSCFSGGNWAFLGSLQNIVKTKANDPIFTNVNSFAVPWARKDAQLVNGTLLASVSNGSPLIAKNEIGQGRIVEFGCVYWSSDVNSNGWQSSTDGHRLFANSIVWASKGI